MTACSTSVTNLQPLILVVEDEPAQAELLLYNLRKVNFRVNHAATGEEAMLLMAEEAPNLIILDWMLPELSGIEICRQIKSGRRWANIPIVMLTARSEETDRIRGLDTGADDYVVKPYSIKELLARVNAILRRTSSTTDDKLTYGDLVLDKEQHKVTRGGNHVRLGPTEFRLLATFMERPGRVWSRDQLLDRAWGRDIYVDTRTVDVHIGRLRKALRISDLPDPIRTVRGFGYSLDHNVS
ncbi:MAG: phosphate regulon transcriptional regulator PhoB [Proteobacteria bacterium]|nr:phosphate regulon transcriptional regulator PhoB [Pseudomonadota bacterium]